MSFRSSSIVAVVVAIAFAGSASASDPTVLRYQKKLAELGSDVGELDGLYGPKTKAAIRSFQEKNGLKASGKIDPVTAAILFSSQEPAEIVSKAEEQEILSRLIEEKLNKYALKEEIDKSLSEKDVELVVSRYLLANPEIMLDVQKALEAKQDAERAEKQKLTLAQMKDAIYTSGHNVEIGPKDAPITIVEFYDYNCGFCQRALADMERLVADGAGVRFILKEFPVLGEPSLEAHKVSLAFARLMPEKAGEFHRKLLGAEGRKDGDVAMQVAIGLGAQEAALRQELAKPDLLDAVRETYKIADGLGVTGTPSYVIGDEVVFGAVGFDQLNTRVANIRQCGKATC